MNRREAISATAFLMGGTIIGAEAFLAGCSTKAENEAFFSVDEIKLLDDIGEVIIPTSPSSPGAKAAKIGEFMKTIVRDCYSDNEQKIFTDGMKKLQKDCQKKTSKVFDDLSSDEKKSFLTQIDIESKKYEKDKKKDDDTHYFTMMKQLTIWGFFTSEIGAKEVLRLTPVPGKFEGCINYSDGQKAWASY